MSAVPAAGSGRRPAHRIELPDGRVWQCPNGADARIIWEEIFEHGVYREAADLLQRGATVLDVGANTGLAALYFAGRVEDPHVLAFEPAEALFGCLGANLRRYLPGAAAHRVALGERRGTGAFTYYPNAPSQSGFYADPRADAASTAAYLVNRGVTEEDAAVLCADLHVSRAETVPVSTVSDVLAEGGVGAVDLIKIDVERAEMDVLLGVEPGDWCRVGAVVMEVHDVDGRADRCSALLREHGFDVSVTREAWLRGSELRTVLARRSGAGR